MVITIEEILMEAMRAGASDVHLTVGVPPKMRVDGSLTAMSYPSLAASDTLAMLISVMSESQREIFEERGDYDMAFAVRDVGRFRVNAYKQRGSVAMAIRLVSTDIPSAEQLGMPRSVAELYQKKQGLILVTGPAGCGKSATMAALIDRINSQRETHIITLEDPMEYQHHHKLSIVNQREIGLDCQDYVSALESALREDPDVILVGDMRDLETIGAVITAAETGHLVLASLHTTGVVNSVERMVDLFPTYRQQQIRIRLANVLEAVISQQLLPALEGGGRIAAFEVLHGTRTVRSLIREGRMGQLPAAMQAGRKLGMVTMDEAIGRLLEEGVISKETAVWYAQQPEFMNGRI